MVPGKGSKNGVVRCSEIIRAKVDSATLHYFISLKKSSLCFKIGILGGDENFPVLIRDKMGKIRRRIFVTVFEKLCFEVEFPPKMRRKEKYQKRQISVRLSEEARCWREFLEISKGMRRRNFGI